MKKLLFSIIFGMLFFVSSINAFEMKVLDENGFSEQGLDGKTLFESNGCTMCHDTNMETVGPSLITIRMSYGMDENALMDFFKGNAEARVYPAKASMMRPQLSKIRNLYEDEQRALARYILDISNF